MYGKHKLDANRYQALTSSEDVGRKCSVSRACSRETLGRRLWMKDWGKKWKAARERVFQALVLACPKAQKSEAA